MSKIWLAFGHWQRAISSPGTSKVFLHVNIILLPCLQPRDDQDFTCYTFFSSPFLFLISHLLSVKTDRKEDCARNSNKTYKSCIIRNSQLSPRSSVLYIRDLNLPPLDCSICPVVRPATPTLFFYNLYAINLLQWNTYDIRHDIQHNGKTDVTALRLSRPSDCRTARHVMFQFHLSIL